MAGLSSSFSPPLGEDKPYFVPPNTPDTICPGSSASQRVRKSPGELSDLDTPLTSGSGVDSQLRSSVFLRGVAANQQPSLLQRRPDSASFPGNNRGPEFSFPDHFNGHFTGCLEDGPAIYSNWNVPPAPPNLPASHSHMPHLRLQQQAHFRGPGNSNFFRSYQPRMMSQAPQYPVNFDNTPHDMYANMNLPQQMNQMTFNGGMAYNHPPAGLVSYNTGFNSAPADSNMNMMSNYNQNNMMARPPGGPAPQQFPGYNTDNFNGAPIGFNPNMRVNNMQFGDADYPFARPAGFLESGYGGGAMISPTNALGSLYSFDVNKPPPFIDLTRFAWPSDNPVVKIMNIPFNITKDEVRQFMKRFLLPHGGEEDTSIVAVHILMEKTNAKTQDCFIELSSLETQRVVMNRFDNMLQSSRPPKMGNRHISVEAGCQADLMKELFPRAHSIIWSRDFGIPIMAICKDPYSHGFNGFLTTEELHMMVRYTVDPDRNPYNGKCLQRTFESMMMILSKFPWASIYYSFGQRQDIWDAYRKQLEYLTRKVNPAFSGRDERTVGLDSRLLESFVDAGLNCPGFAEWQKNEIVSIIGGSNQEYGLSNLAGFWPFECLGKPLGVSDQDIAMWLELMASGAKELLETLPNQIWISKYLRAELGEMGRLYVKAMDDTGILSFRDLARVESAMMYKFIGKGWEKWFRTRCIDPGRLPLPPRSTRLDVELDNKMRSMGVYHNGVHASKELDKHYFPKQAELENRDLRLLENTNNGDTSVDENATPRPSTESEAPVAFHNPFQGATGNRAAPAQVAEMGNIVFGSFGPGMNTSGSGESGGATVEAPVKQGQPAVTFNPARAGRRESKAVPIKKPDGQYVEFETIRQGVARTKTMWVPAAKDKAKGKAKDDDDLALPSRRESVTKSSSESHVSPTTSPDNATKSLSAGGSPTSNKAQDPIGTPSRRPQSDKTVKVSQTFDEDDDEGGNVLLMSGGRRGHASRGPV